MVEDKLVGMCKKFGGKVDDNFCILNKKEQQVVISMFTPLTKNIPKEHMNEKDFTNILKFTDKQKHQNFHFYCKQYINKTLLYGGNAYIGDFPKKEYYGGEILINKSNIIKQPNNYGRA